LIYNIYNLIKTINIIINNMTNNTNNTDKRVEQMMKVQYEGLELFKKKNTDYGDAFATYGAIGVLVRIGDKILRLQSITKNSLTLVNSESIRDTLIDLHNYSAMAIMLLDESVEENYPHAPPPSPLSDTRPDLA
jgi:intracellular sulfur oxidation DsrE/DsrF family protein